MLSAIILSDGILHFLLLGVYWFILLVGLYFFIMAKPKPFNNTKYTIFATRTQEFTPGETASGKMLLTEYCKQKFITRKQLMWMVKKNWYNVTKVRGRIYVEERCSDLIEDHLLPW